MNFEPAWNTIQVMVNGTIAILPNLILACLIFLVFSVVGKRISMIVRLMTDKRQKTRNAGMLLGKLTQAGVVTAGALVVLPIVIPSFQVGHLIQLLGISSVAIGFAFHAIFQNFLAGLLLHLTAPFRVGDDISVGQFEGTVEDIQTSATTLRTYDGRRVVIPNSDLFTHSVTVHTAFHMRRIHYALTIDEDTDIRQTKLLLLEALHALDGVMKEPAPEVLVTGLTNEGTVLQIFCWTQGVHHSQLLRSQDRILTTIKETLVAHHIRLPIPSQKIQVVRHQREVTPDIQ